MIWRTRPAKPRGLRLDEVADHLLGAPLAGRGVPGQDGRREGGQLDPDGRRRGAEQVGRLARCDGSAGHQNHASLFATFSSGSPRAKRPTLSRSTARCRSAIRGEAPGDVRGEDDVLHGPERVVRRQRLDLEDVEPRPGELAGPQRRHQVGEVHDRAAPDVDQVAGPLHLAEPRPVEQLRRLGRVRRGDDDEVARAQQVGQPVEPPQRGDAVGRSRLDGIDGQHPHPEREAPPGDLARRSGRAPRRRASGRRGGGGRGPSALTTPGPAANVERAPSPPAGSQRAAAWFRM